MCVLFWKLNLPPELPYPASLFPPPSRGVSGLPLVVEPLMEIGRGSWMFPLGLNLGLRLPRTRASPLLLADEEN